MSLIPAVKAPAKIKKKKLTAKQKKAWVKKKNKALVKQVATANSSPFKGGCFARWGKKTWKVTADKINTLSDAAWSDEWDAKKKARLASEAVFEFPLYKDLMPKLDLASEIRSWRNLIGKSGYLYLGGTLFGTQKKYRLTNVDVSNVELIRGEIVHCDIELTFTEIKKSKSKKLPKRKKKATTKKKTTKKKKKTTKKTTKKK